MTIMTIETALRLAEIVAGAASKAIAARQNTIEIDVDKLYLDESADDVLRRVMEAEEKRKYV